MKLLIVLNNSARICLYALVDVCGRAMGEAAATATGDCSWRIEVAGEESSCRVETWVSAWALLAGAR